LTLNYADSGRPVHQEGAADLPNRSPIFKSPRFE
jgi:hypothetical protein